MMSLKFPLTSKAWRLPADDSSWKNHRDMSLREIRLEAPGKGDVVIKIHAISERQYPLPVTHGPDNQGLIMASDAAGEVVAVGTDVSEWKIGDRIQTCFCEAWEDGELKIEYANHIPGSSTLGFLTQYSTVSSRAIVKMPDYLSYEEAATLPCAALTAWNALFGIAPLTPNSTILAIGSGGVSVFGAQFAKAIGAKVIALTSSDEKAQLYKSLSVDEVVNDKKTPQWGEDVRRLTDGLGVDHVLEVGGPTTIEQSIMATRSGGHIHLISQLGGNTEVDLSQLWLKLIFGGLHLHGTGVGSKSTFRRLNAFVAEHKIKPAIHKVFEWEQAVEALDYLAAGSHVGKLVIKVA